MGEDRNPVLSITVEFDPDHYPLEDLSFFKGEALRNLERLFPGAAVSVRAGQLRWLEAA